MPQTLGWLHVLGLVVCLSATSGCESKGDSSVSEVPESAKITAPPQNPDGTPKVIYPAIPERRMNPLGTIEPPPPAPPPQPTHRELATIRCRDRDTGKKCGDCCVSSGRKRGSIFSKTAGCICM